MRSLLPLFMQPSRYTGIEQGSVHKDPATVRLRVILCYPDLYEVGMSHLGQKILYGIVNAHEGWWAERCYEPDAHASDLLHETGELLASLESDLPLVQAACLGFSICHELCYTDVLNMLSLGGIPLRSQDRPESLHDCPLIVSGGGASISAEPIAPFLDAMVLGDGEETFPELLEALEKARELNTPRSVFLRQITQIPGIYVPSLYIPDGEGGLKAVDESIPSPSRRIVADFDAAPFPTAQVVPIATVHSRLSLEIARGCTRSCRFCHAGVVYRPARERKVETVLSLLHKALEETGFEEISFLSLSAGDYSALKSLCTTSFDHCAQEQISLSLPSLRVGSIDDAIMDRMSRVRRTGVTLAPEAGSQRLRNIINKGITEEDIILHAQKLLEYGWRQVKLYFMIGLPGETDDDLRAIAELCHKVRLAGGPGRPKLSVTAALSPFVPKPFTPFQWEDQIDLQEIDRRVRLVHELFKHQKGLMMRWHEPRVSHLEGILSRAGREMANVIERAFHKGAILCGWMEHFTLEPWLEALEECGISPADCIKGKPIGSRLPWSHITCGVSEEFLIREKHRSEEEKVTADCRYAPCRQCGACDRPGGSSLLPHTGTEQNCNRLVFPERDQAQHKPARDADGGILLREIDQKPPKIAPELTVRAAHFRIWHTKTEESCWLSQLELQSVIDRSLRRANIPMAFSQGFHPMPLISFGRALPVGVESKCEWFSITIRSPRSTDQIVEALAPCLLRGMHIIKIETCTWQEKTLQSDRERFVVQLVGKEEECKKRFAAFARLSSFPYTRETKKGPRSYDIRKLVGNIRPTEEGVCFEAIWTESYLSPLLIAKAILEPLCDERELSLKLKVCKVGQSLPNGITI